jgi:hypothetical protein
MLPLSVHRYLYNMATLQVEVNGVWRRLTLAVHGVDVDAFRETRLDWTGVIHRRIDRPTKKAIIKTSNNTRTSSGRKSIL